VNTGVCSRQVDQRVAIPAEGFHTGTPDTALIQAGKDFGAYSILRTKALIMASKLLRSRASDDRICGISGKCPRSARSAR
jgi:hypothetical protein